MKIIARANNGIIIVEMGFHEWNTISGQSVERSSDCVGMTAEPNEFDRKHKIVERFKQDNLASVKLLAEKVDSVLDLLKEVK